LFYQTLDRGIAVWVGLGVAMLCPRRDRIDRFHQDNLHWNGANLHFSEYHALKNAVATEVAEKVAAASAGQVCVRTVEIPFVANMSNVSLSGTTRLGVFTNHQIEPGATLPKTMSALATIGRVLGSLN
jgi:hypothetical protein